MNIDAFYRENYRIVYGYLFGLCGNSHLAEDLTSETFLKAIQKISGYDGRVKASTWLCAIGKNLYYNEMKKRKPLPLDEITIADHRTPEDQMIESQRIRLITQLISALEEPKRQVFRMRWNGMSFRQIGDALGRSENWARVTFFRAKEQILKGLEESE